MDILFINQLTVITTIGIYEWEKNFPQKLLLDIKIARDQHSASSSDDIKNCLNYSDIVKEIISLVSRGQFSLIERVAEEVAACLLNKFPSLWVQVTVSKPNGTPHAQQVGVIIERGNLLPPTQCITCNAVIEGNQISSSVSSM
ncbi:dihydroneopterin aldolase [Candidatus Erwinia haradaeae]|uniref:7,8-dihydroneopterin aldolase n=1 Tax=Candidatus Erwinia haradaeae TaxID=1922217 RepID=A0A451D9V6_9GAMM|nr:dihydroneopterin aldolase [Candidatus Erwinia haradaeae]VFP83070.1 Dihydroneopterin aldolase [Candidatus Erwinia haradaeae]